MGELIKSYPKDMKYTSRGSDYQRPTRLQQAYTSKCALFNLTYSDALQAFLIAIDEHSPAGAWYCSQSRVAHLTDEWQSLHSADISMSQAKEKLYEKYVHLQSRLDAIHQPDAILIEFLSTSVNNDEF